MITIILLIILATVSINIIFGENGLIARAEQGQEIQSEAEAREKLEMKLADMQVKKLSNSAQYDENDYLTKQLEDEGFIVVNDIVEADGYQFSIDRSVPKIISNVEKLQNNNRKYLYRKGNECTETTGGFETQSISMTYYGQLTGISEIKKYTDFMKIYSYGNGNGNATHAKIQSKNYLNKENYDFLIIEMMATSTDSYNRPIISLINETGESIYVLNLNSGEIKDRTYLKIPLENIEEDFQILLETSAVYSGVLELYIYNIFFSNGVDEEVQSLTLPQGQEKVYILNGSSEYENYSGGWMKGEFRYYNTYYNGTSYVDIQDEYVTTFGISNGSGYGSGSYYTSGYLDRGEYTKLNIEFEATSTDNYSRDIISLYDKSRNVIYNYTQKANETIEKNTLQIDLIEINEKFKVEIAANAVLGGSTATRVYSVYFSK